MRMKQFPQSHLTLLTTFMFLSFNLLNAHAEIRESDPEFVQGLAPQQNGVHTEIATANHVMHFDLKESPRGIVNGTPATAQLPEGATFLSPEEGGGVRPGTGSAVVIDLPSEIWTPSGSLGFQFRPSRVFRFREGSPVEVELLRSPMFQISLRELRNHSSLLVTLETEEDSPNRGDDISLSRLEDRWYHCIVAWDIEKGLVEIYLNGVLQERLRRLGEGPLVLPEDGEFSVSLGGVLPDEEGWIEIRNVSLREEFVEDEAATAWADASGAPPLDGEGRTVRGAPLDLSEYRKKLVYEADFEQPILVVKEADLFEGEERVRKPQEVDWVLEGEGDAWSEDGVLQVRNDGHVVLWNTRDFPEDFLLEFGFSREREEAGLGIVFFSQRARDGGDIFAPGLPRRDGDFRTYHSGELDGYHISYVSSARRTANLRKNAGFYMPSVGNDLVNDRGTEQNLIRILKVGGLIILESNGEVALQYEDDGETYGPVWTGPGKIGLRQMANMHQGRYTHFRVWQIEKPE